MQLFSPNCANANSPSTPLTGAINFQNFSQSFLINQSQIFRVRCSDNNCYGEWSNKVRVDVIPPKRNPCNDDPVLDAINKITKSGRSDYHKYEVETVVCDKSTGNPNCTVQKVFDLMKGNKTYSTPIAVDFPEALITADVGNWETKIPLFGSRLVFEVDDSPVEDCETVNLPSGFGMAANLAALASVVASRGSTLPVYKFVKTASIGTANPVAQYIDASYYTVTNYTKPGHILHPGKVVRKVVEDCDKIKIVTVGFGESWAGDNPLGSAMGWFNERSGKVLFNNIDQRLIQAFNRLP